MDYYVDKTFHSADLPNLYKRKRDLNLSVLSKKQAAIRLLVKDDTSKNNNLLTLKI